MNSPLLHRHLLPVAKAHTTLQLAALTGAILHKVQVKSSEGHTLQVIYKSSVEGGCPPAPAAPQRRREYVQGTGRILRPTGKDEMASWGGGTIPLSGPQFLPSYVLSIS